VEPLAAQTSPPIRASDEDRERTVAILREHWRAGRLTLEEFEARCEEAWGARMVSGLWHAVRELPLPAPAVPASRAGGGTGGAAAAVSSFVLGLIATCILVLTVGLFSWFSTPLSAVAWGLGGHAKRRGAAGGNRSLAAAGEVLGFLGTIVGALVFIFWVMVVFAPRG
jgi:Domain of unknown function (DUF1707)